MPTVTIQIQAGAQTMGRSKTVTTEHLQRLATAIRNRAGNPMLTDQQVVELWADELLQITKQWVRIEEERAAIRNAQNNLNDIDLT